MSATRVQGQQGDTNVSSATQVVKTDVDYKLNLRDDLVVATAAVTLTLPDAPYQGEKHTIAGDGGVATVTGGAFPIAGGDGTVPNGKMASVVFSTEGRWIPDCCLVQIT
jgi:hypothetical protein